MKPADLAAPLRFSTDPTERLSTDPLRYGTRSTWRGADPATQPFLFLPVAVQVPGDQEDAPAALRLALDLFDAALVTALRGVTGRPAAHMAVVLAETPDVVEVEFLDLQVMGIEYGDQLVVTASRKPIEDEGWPMDRMTKARFPGLFR